MNELIAIDTEGLHPATSLFLEVLQRLHERHDFHNVLDMGCGSGILSAVAAGAWDAKVLAADISEKAVLDTQKHIAGHGFENHVTAIRSDGFSHPLIRAQAPYDLILFNLLAEFLVEMAPEVKSSLVSGGVAVIGGILAWKAEGVKDAYKTLGFEIIEEISNSPWHILLVRHPSVI